MESATTSIIGVVFEILNILMHGVGIWLLVCTFIRGQKSTQTMYIINLAISEIIKNIFLLIVDLLLVGIYSTDNRNLVIGFWYVNAFFATGVIYNYTLSMFYITADRLFHIILHVKYPVYWSVGKTKRLLICSWVFCLTISTSFTLVLHFVYKSVVNEDEVYLRIFLIYIPIVLYIIYVLFACLTYTKMFLQFARSRTNRNARRLSLFNIFINSRFFVSVLLISSFLLLMVTPRLIYSILFIAILYQNNSCCI